MKKAIIVDIDGTLTHFDSSKRGPYEFHLAHLDSPNPAVVEIIRLLFSWYIIIIVSGREDRYIDTTQEWLKANQIPYHTIHLRRSGDIRPDSEVKKEIFHSHIDGKYDVLAVFDDRNRVVSMWRKELGLPCFQVEEGNF